MGDAFPISGNIDATAFPFLLVSLHEQGATGSLKVDGPTYQKALYFRAGRVLFGSSNDPRDQLGSILIESGRITPEQLEEVNAKVGPGNPLAKVLADSGFVSQRELSEAARAKVELIVGDVMSYDAGSFEFEDGVLPKGAIDLKLSTEKLFVAAARRVSERGFVLRHLGGLDAVLELKAEAQRLDELRPECAGLLETLDGKRTLKEAIALTRLDEFEAGKVACGLLFLGVASKRGAERASFSGIEEDAALAQAAQAAFQPDATSPGLDAPFFLDSPSFALEPPPPAPAPPNAPAFALPASDETFKQTLAMPKPREPETVHIPAAIPEPPPPPMPELPPRGATPAPARPPLPSVTPGGSRLPLVPPPPRKAPVRAPVRQEQEPELPLAKPSSPPPSRADLAAVDALLNSRGIEGPLSGSTRSAPSRAPAWEPRFGQQAARPARARAGLSPGLIGAIVVLLGIAGASAWYLGLRPNTSTPGRPQPSRAAASPVATAPPSGQTPTPQPSERPAATPTAVPPPGTLAPLTPPPATPPPSSAPSTGGTPGTIADARAALRRGSVADAGRGFAAALKRAPRGTYTVQLLVACSEETIGKATQAVPGDELFVVPVTLKGRACQRMCWGLYDSVAKAQSALAAVPAYFRDGGATPKPMATAEILP